MTRLQIDQHARVLDAWHTQKESLGPEWAAVASLNDYGMRLRPDQARALADELNAVLDRWMTEYPGDQPAEGTELVFVLTDLVPLKEWPL